MLLRSKKRLLINSRRLFLCMFTFFYFKGFSVAFYCLHLCQRHRAVSFHKESYNLLVGFFVKHDFLPLGRGNCWDNAARGNILCGLSATTGFSSSWPLLLCITILLWRCHQLLSILLSNGIMHFLFFLLYTTITFIK